MNYIRGYDGLRAISILFVIVTHLGLYDLILPESDYFRFHVYKLISGTSGVMIFFTLSGFLIVSILLKEKAKLGYVRIKVFFIKRFLRLLPPLVIFYSLTLFLMLIGQLEKNYIGLTFSAIYLYNYIPKEIYSKEIGHTWSLAIEEQFYLFAPFSILKFGKKMLFNFLIALYFLSIVFLFIFAFLRLDGHWLHENFMLNRWFFPAAMPIIIGALLAYLIHFVQQETLIYLKRKKNQILILSILTYCIPLAPFIPSTIAIVLQPIGVALILLYIYIAQNSILSSVLEVKVIRYIGRISYGLYVYQGLFLRTGPGSELLFQQFPANIILTILISILSFEFIEKPILSLKNKYKLK